MLLHILEGDCLTRVGGRASIPMDVRIVAATNRDLQRAIRAGTFRADLYYRLDVFSVVLPLLRERREDIPLLATQVLSRPCVIEHFSHYKGYLGHRPLARQREQARCETNLVWAYPAYKENEMKRTIIMKLCVVVLLGSVVACKGVIDPVVYPAQEKTGRKTGFIFRYPRLWKWVTSGPITL